MNFLRRLILGDAPDAAQHEQDKVAEVDELLARSDRALSEKDRVTRTARAVAAYRHIDDERRAHSE